jgi:uncharacterized protein (UPF0332 family)
MSYKKKVAENKKVAEKCMEIKAYNAGVTRAYYSAFLHIKDYLLSNNFDYTDFLRRKGKNEKAFSHGTIQEAAVSCLMINGKSPIEVYRLAILDNLYSKRRRADYEKGEIIEAELNTSLKDLDTVLSTVS